MILLSNGGSNWHRSDAPSSGLVVGTVDGIVVLDRSTGRWRIAHQALRGCFVSAVTAADDGTLFAATHGFGVARSEDGGYSWTWTNVGLDHFDLWSARAGRLMGRDVVCVGSLPAHVFISCDRGITWRDLPAIRNVPSASKWCFPPPPRVGHVKDIVIDGERLLVGIEIGALLVSKDFGESFTDLRIDSDPVECDVHRILVHPDRPNRIIVANGIVGVMTTEDAGVTWRRNPMPADAHYSDSIVLHPDKPDTVFLTAAVGWPSHWYRLGRHEERSLEAATPECTGSASSAVCRTVNARRSARLQSRRRRRATASMPQIPTARSLRASTEVTAGRLSLTSPGVERRVLSCACQGSRQAGYRRRRHRRGCGRTTVRGEGVTGLNMNRMSTSIKSVGSSMQPAGLYDPTRRTRFSSVPPTGTPGNEPIYGVLDDPSAAILRVPSCPLTPA